MIKVVTASCWIVLGERSAFRAVVRMPVSLRIAKFACNFPMKGVLRASATGIGEGFDPVQVNDYPLDVEIANGTEMVVEGEYTGATPPAFYIGSPFHLTFDCMGASS